MGHKKRSQMDSMDLLHFRRTQLAKTGTGQTYDETSEEPVVTVNHVEADFEVPAAPRPW